MSTGEYWPELENNHHYIIVDSEHDRTFYCPAEEAANTLSRILNQKNKIIRNLKSEKLEVYEIKSNSKHIAYVIDEELAKEFCMDHKDCSYNLINIAESFQELSNLI
ncbi:hypothetical protein [Methanobrevibacter sp.]|uniref:hypothetical protein n=1 Tax=Methanobrevibacter sp. TaxID=66852 RepID=UPI0025F2B4CB|nr:hypothetical protein [Methanobrevibacter sp.]MBQ2832400.1 hypothetical protein [Methanobrevibacter sp.]